MRRCSSVGMELRYLFASDTPGLRSAPTASLRVLLMFLRRLRRPIFLGVCIQSWCAVAREFQDVGMTEIGRGSGRERGGRQLRENALCPQYLYRRQTVWTGKIRIASIERLFTRANVLHSEKWYIICRHISWCGLLCPRLLMGPRMCLDFP